MRGEPGDDGRTPERVPDLDHDVGIRIVTGEQCVRAAELGTAEGHVAVITDADVVVRAPDHATSPPAGQRPWPRRTLWPQISSGFDADPHPVDEISGISMKRRRRADSNRVP
jgi:hypothetical protein